MAAIEMHIKKAKGFGKLRGGKAEKKYTQSKDKEVHVKMCEGATPAMVHAMARMIERSTK